MTVLITFIQGDITEQDTDAIVNSANPRLSPGGGISGRIHQKAGIELSFAVNKQIKESTKGFLETGDAIISHGGNLPAKYIIHTVGPKYTIHKDTRKELLAKCYISSLSLAIEKGIKTISFPSISTGIYGCPIEICSQIAVKTVKAFTQKHPEIEEVRFVLFSENDYEIYKKLL